MAGMQTGVEIGTLAKWNPDRGFGFIRRHGTDDHDVFLHIDQIVGGDKVRVGDQLMFAVQDTSRGLRATQAKVISNADSD